MSRHQVRIDAVAEFQIADVARHENRSRSNATNKLVGLGYRHWSGTTTTHEPPTPVDDGSTIRGRYIACHVSNVSREAIELFAEREERSLSSAMAVLLRAGLRAYGVTLPSRGNDPITRSAAMESAA